MASYAFRRTLIAIPTLFATSIVIFLMVRLMPGNVIDYITSGTAVLTPQERQQMEHALGLDHSYAYQYVVWMKGLLTGNLGNSLVSTIPVAQTLKSAIPITAELVFYGLVIALVLAIPLGILSAMRPNSWGDFASRIGGLVGLSMGRTARNAAVSPVFTSRACSTGCHPCHMSRSRMTRAPTCSSSCYRQFRSRCSRSPW